MSAHASKESHFSPSAETCWRFAAMSAESVEFAVSGEREQDDGVVGLVGVREVGQVGVALADPPLVQTVLEARVSLEGPAGVVPLAPSMLEPAGHFSSAPKFLRLPSTRYSCDAG